MELMKPAFPARHWSLAGEKIGLRFLCSRGPAAVLKNLGPGAVPGSEASGLLKLNQYAYPNSLCLPHSQYIVFAGQLTSEIEEISGSNDTADKH